MEAVPVSREPTKAIRAIVSSRSEPHMSQSKSSLTFWQRLLLAGINLYPPFFFAGIKARRLRDPSGWESSLKLRFWNRNFVGTHYGGSLFSMCDPFFMLLFFELFEGEFIVWDKEASIRFLKPSRDKVTARFVVSNEEVVALRSRIETEGKVEKRFTTLVVDGQGEVVAEVEKLLYFRRKK